MAIVCDYKTCGCHKHGIPLIHFSEKYSSAWYSNPKAASTSLKRLLKIRKPTGKTFIDSFGSFGFDRIRPIPEGIDSFAFVRNPWDRMVSNYEMFKKRPPNYSEGLTFDEWLKKIKDKKIINHHWANQTLFVPSHVKFFKIEEDLEQALDWLNARLPIDESLMTINKTDHQPYQEYYTKELIELVGDLFAEDIDTFGYRFS